MIELTEQQARAAVDQVLDHHPPDRLPRLISHRAVDDARDEVAALVVGLADEDMTVLRAWEEISMPRGRFGSRPVRFPTLHEMALFHHLTGLVSDVGFAVRTGAQRDVFYSFGCGEGDTHQARFDISAYYEYIAHDRLRDELALRGHPPPVIRALLTVLSFMYESRRGLPQMLRASDVLADIYLAPVDRVLNRQGYAFERYADDFRVNVGSWRDALALMDDITERVRDLGLTLASVKTMILTRDEVARRDGHLEALLDAHVSALRGLLLQEVWVGGYGEPDVVDLELDDQQAVYAALLTLADAWLEQHRERAAKSQEERARNPLTELLPGILGRLQGAGADFVLAPEFLQEVPFADPVRLQAVCRYVAEGPLEDEDRWGLLKHLVMQGRQSPWARVWLAQTVVDVWNGEHAPPDVIVEWLRDVTQSDRHELVRAESAYAMAALGEAGNVNWQGLVDRATVLTFPGLAAAAGRAGIDSERERAFTGPAALPLMKSAFTWGRAQNG